MNTCGQPELVSIIVASYNHAEYLNQRMESLINQTYQEIEILVIDDCSTDNSLNILRKYESHPKVKLIAREKNGGWVSVSNQGVSLSRGEYIIFANCDDSCHPEMIEQLVMSMRRYSSAGLSFCRSLLIDTVGHVVGNDFEIREPRFKNRCAENVLINKKEMSHFLLHSCVIPNLSGVLFRRSCYSESGGLTSKYRVCSDWELFFKVVEKYDAAYIATSLNEFRQHKTTIRNSTKQRVLMEEILSILLGRVVTFKLTFTERIKFRFRAMQIWAEQLIRPPLSNLASAPYIIRVIFSLDPVAIFFLPFAVFFRFLQLPAIIFNRFCRKIT